jgi:hypothetical protein
MSHNAPLTTPVVRTAEDEARQQQEHRLELLIDRVPSDSIRSSIRWLRRPSSRWARIPAGMLLLGGGLLSFLPILGLWMLPVGLALLAEDIPILRRGRDRTLDWIAQRRPHWIAHEQSPNATAIPCREGLSITDDKK